MNAKVLGAADAQKKERAALGEDAVVAYVDPSRSIAVTPVPEGHTMSIILPPGRPEGHECCGSWRSEQTEVGRPSWQGVGVAKSSS